MATHVARMNYTLYVGGHTHLQLFRVFDSAILLNPGSVGAPFKSMNPDQAVPEIQPWAEYALVDFTRGNPNIQMQRINYDLVEFTEILRQSDLPVKEWWLSQLLISY
jgi:hypothetical protein